MRLAGSLFPLLALAGICAAQDTNFAAGPQYLITSPSPMFLHSIATPSLSFAQPSSAPFPSETSSAIAPPLATETVPASQVVETPAPLPNNIDLSKIYWGGPEAGGISGEESSEVVLGTAQPSQNLPASIMNIGVTAMVDPRSLREEGYGVSLGEVASFWKAHGGHAGHTYTNKDVERVPGS